MKKLVAIGVICLIIVVMLFLFTDPNRVPSLILVLPFILIFSILTSLVTFIQKRLDPNNTKSLRIGLLCAAVPTALLVLQSIGQLTLRDILIIGALFPMAYFYIRRLSTSQ